MANSSEKTYFLVHYRDPVNGENASIKAKKISDSSLGLSFIALSDFVFETHSIVVNPDEESRKIEFENIKTLHLSIYSVLSISEIGAHKKALSFTHDKAKLLMLNKEPHGNPSN